MIDCSLVVISCDKNMAVADGFSKYFEKYWPNCSFDKYMLTETKDFALVGFQSVMCVGDFSSRILSFLTKIQTKYVLVMLDDFYIEEIVDETKILNALDFMSSDERIANFGFSKFLSPTYKNSSHGEFVLRKKIGYSLMNYQVGIWNKNCLVKLLKAGENPWDSEWFGTNRAIYSNMKFYGLKTANDSPIKYGSGWLIVRGTWNLAEVYRLELKTGIPINKGALPFEKNISTIPLSIKEKIWTKIRIYRNRIKTFFIRRIKV